MEMIQRFRSLHACPVLSMSKNVKLQSLSQSSKNLWVETAFQMGNEYGLRSSFLRAEKIFGDLKEVHRPDTSKALCKSRVLGLKTLLQSPVQSTI
jgi:hypothetical protein